MTQHPVPSRLICSQAGEPFHGLDASFETPDPGLLDTSAHERRGIAERADTQPVYRAVVDVASGHLTVVDEAGDLAVSPLGGLTEQHMTPWGVEEQGMTRADEALTNLGWSRVAGCSWTQSDAPTSEWTCQVHAI